jgi:phenylalanyl-tRNA synthetase beta chain
MKWPSIDEFKVDDHSLEIPVIVEDAEACPRYSGVTMTGIRVAESPAWLKDLLQAAGIRPINNIVDVTNFILMELGQPLHAFDAARIKGKKVVVRKARQDEPFVTLDEMGRKLTPDDLMICNAEVGMCIAGVFGGAESGVSDGTTDIFLESAHFSPRSIRKTSRYHGLQTDASFRFERGSDPNITVYALKRAALLIKQVAGGKISSEIADFYPHPKGPAKISVTWKNIARLIGQDIQHEAVRSILSDLGIRIITEDGIAMQLEVPTFKTDVLREADIIEEVLRIYGYDYIEMPGRLKSSLSFATRPDPEVLRNLVADLLTSRGFYEIMNNSLTRSKYCEDVSWMDPTKNVLLLNPLSSDLNVMRQTLLFGGLETIAYNINRKNPDLKLYEFGRTYAVNQPAGAKPNLGNYSEQEYLALWITGNRQTESWRDSSAGSDLFDLKETVIAIFTRLGFNTQELEISESHYDSFQECLGISFGKSDVVRLGRLSKKLLKLFDLKQDVYYAEVKWEMFIELVKNIRTDYREIPRFPEVRRDLALVMDKSVTYEALKQAAFQAECSILRNVNLFDIYEGDRIEEGKKSYAMSFILRDDEKTLTDQVIDKTMERILRSFTEKFNAVIR